MLARFLVVLLTLTGAASAQPNPDWTQPFPPYRIAGNLYYVGSKDLAAYLITTPQGHILINSNLKSSPPLIRKSVEQLGFRFADIKILLISHAHFDHCSGSALVKKMTHARYMVMDADVPEIENGGKGNFAFGKSPAFLYPPARVDRVLHDGDKVALGNAVLVAHITPGHTKGCTTWTLQVADHQKLYNVVIVGSPNVLSEYNLLNDPLYPHMARDFERTFRTMKALPCDIFLGSHGSYFGMTEKIARLKEGQPNPFIDPAGYRSYVADREQAFLTQLEKQQQAHPHLPPAAPTAKP